MKFIYLFLVFFVFNANAMILIEVTDIQIINYFSSILINLTAFIAPLFGALALLRH
ncbi:MAG TPA: hypothetical protein VLZ29_01225 [Sulfurimonas sp.]|uniref:hypothetical protein n=1 Tax=Sulfurimonas sp. TaxID=2022749 RepID=UPI002C0E4B36|nr:hypothetical protein [Sulfurimonas sp.]HUH41719.1 hypothetical protein [Sulfurimonas sp.]